MTTKNFTFSKEFINDIFLYKNGELFWKKPRKKTFIGEKAGHINKKGYHQITINKKIYPLHRIIFFMFHGYFPDCVDHIDNDKNNNKIENLRAATLTQNQYNKPISPKNTSGYKNVCLDKKTNKWFVRMRLNGKDQNFGSYFNKEIANFVASTMRHKYHKEFAKN